MDDWLLVLLVLTAPVVTLGALGFVLMMANRTSTNSSTVFERDASGNIAAVVYNERVR